MKFFISTLLVVVLVAVSCSARSSYDHHSGSRSSSSSSRYHGVIKRQMVFRNPQNQQEICVTKKRVHHCEGGYQAEEQKTKRTTGYCITPESHEMEQQMEQIRERIQQGERISWSGIGRREKVEVQTAKKCVSGNSRSNSMESRQPQSGRGHMLGEAYCGDGAHYFCAPSTCVTGTCGEAKRDEIAKKNGWFYKCQYNNPWPLKCYCAARFPTDIGDYCQRSQDSQNHQDQYNDY